MNKSIKTSHIGLIEAFYLRPLKCGKRAHCRIKAQIDGALNRNLHLATIEYVGKRYLRPVFKFSVVVEHRAPLLSRLQSQQLAMTPRARSNEDQASFIDTINKEPVRLNMALTMASIRPA